MSSPSKILLDPMAPRSASHVAIIMDGNGRWAQARGLPRFEGHRRGVEALRKTVRAAIEFGVAYLTIYSFSTENWNRPPDEVSMLMKRFSSAISIETSSGGRYQFSVEKL